MSDFITVKQGSSALILSFPHTGTAIPDKILGRLAGRGLALKDTDWFVDRLYMPLAEAFGASVVHTAISRTVIDVNRDPSGRSLYPGRATTGLVPTETFDGEPLYPAGGEPDEPEIAERRATYFEPYHAALAAEAERVLASHGLVFLYDCHSIQSVAPRLFDGELPVFNIGTDDGRSCAPGTESVLASVCRSSGVETVVNGRFKGGWITRHYGDPARGVHAVQMEIARRGYMREPARNDPPPQDLDLERAGRLRDILKIAFAAMLAGD